MKEHIYPNFWMDYDCYQAALLFALKARRSMQLKTVAEQSGAAFLTNYSFSLMENP